MLLLARSWILLCLAGEYIPCSPSAGNDSTADCKFFHHFGSLIVNNNKNL